MEKKFYKVNLKVNLKNDLKVEDYYLQIKKLAEDFSEECDFEKDIKLIEGKDNIINLLVSLLYTRTILR